MSDSHNKPIAERIDWLFDLAHRHGNAFRAPEAWLEAVERSGHGIAEREELDAETRAAEMLMMGLRLTEGVREDSFALETGRTLDEALEPSRLAALIEGGYLERGDGNLRATASGRLRLNAVLARLLG